MLDAPYAASYRRWEDHQNSYSEAERIADSAADNQPGLVPLYRLAMQQLTGECRDCVLSALYDQMIGECAITGGAWLANDAAEVMEGRAKAMSLIAARSALGAL